MKPTAKIGKHKRKRFYEVRKAISHQLSINNILIHYLNN